MSSCYTAYEVEQGAVARTPHKDYSRPLHVDCSVEYELPNQAKPPVGVRNEPLLMIHPCYFRKIESQRRSPFVNNLPVQQQQQPAAATKRKPPSYPQHQQQQQHAAMQHHGRIPPPQYVWDPTATACQQHHSPGKCDEGRHILAGKYRQYLRAHRLHHPYVTTSMAGLAAFPHIQQVCYNV